ncbi:type III secretion system outer membrane ring subunit SctC [Lampropedia aestuarii]|uniref:type III secretion system outer membrane ring subunit SctC n=1 Tax=Lampropedia aestuarii TaxID=2562762 RepID=UPI0024686DE9|nr:type III secretion system outer membrane ring subunit SctC [Lampropedia aestuarii]MDH5857346.1 type III secretion system outer membrane ring subunit SctC [Lampropedia aestuarii]
MMFEYPLSASRWLCAAPRPLRQLAASMALGLAAVVAPSWASPPPWTASPYNYYATRPTPLADVLKEFAATFSLTLDLSPQVQGTVNGRMRADSPTDFLNEMAGVYGFQWFTHAGTLFISRAADMGTASVSASGGSIGQLRDALRSLQILDDRFGWGELTDQGIALISGPPAYVSLVQRTVQSLPLVAGGRKITVFRLKYASVQDRTITYRDQTITSRGLAEVLRDLIRGDTSSMSMPNAEGLYRMAEPLRAGVAQTMPVSGGQLPSAAPLVNPLGNFAPTEANEAPLQPAAQLGTGAGNVVVNRQAPSIEADTRLNALIIQDTPDRMPIYEALIKQLDVPTALIEIEALIIDVNTTRLDELGIAWGGRKGGTAAGYGDVSEGSGGLTISAARPGANISTTTAVLDAGNYLVTRIRALEGLGEATIQSRPSILTVDNTGALLDLSETFYIRTTGERVATVTPITVGTTLRVTPRHIEDEQHGQTIQLDVDIEDGQIQSREVDGLPTVRRSNVSTQAVVGENQTLVIGGYNTQNSTHSNERVPLLGSIPLLGSFFSHKVDNREARERLFLIKPRLVTLPAEAGRTTLAAGARAPSMAIPQGREFPHPVEEMQQDAAGNWVPAPRDQPVNGVAPLVNPPGERPALPASVAPASRWARAVSAKPGRREFPATYGDR